MQLKFALVADVVSETIEGKLNIVGEFDTIYSGSVPALWPSFSLAVRLLARPTEGSIHSYQIAISHINGTEVFPQTPDQKLKFVPAHARGPLKGQIIARFGGTIFPDWGMYEVRVWIDRRLVATVPIRVVRGGVE